MKRIQSKHVNALLTAIFFLGFVALYLLGSHLVQTFVAPSLIRVTAQRGVADMSVILRGSLDAAALLLAGALTLVVLSLAARLLMSDVECRKWVGQFAPGTSVGVDRWIRRFTLYFLTLIPFREPPGTT